MAGMFYSLEEVAQKLNLTKEQVTQMVQEGKLREFRDGPNLLFKVDEVEALASDEADKGDSGEEAEIEAEEFSADELSLEEEPDLEVGSEELSLASDIDEPFMEDQAQVSPEEPSEEAQIDQPSEADAEEPSVDFAEESEISLADSADGAMFDSDLTSADTSITADDINVLGESESDFAITDDSMADTLASGSSPGESDELSLASSSGDGLDIDSESGSQEQSITSFGDDSLPSLEGDSVPGLDDESALAASGGGSGLEGIDDDVNLDSFGSGSGLLDLSLQADDTSLGGILDEIYTPQDGGEQAEMPLGQASSEMNAEVDQMLGGDDGGEPIAAPAVAPMAARPAYAEPVPDSVSNAFGYMMFLPLLALIYMGIAGIAGHVGIKPMIIEKTQDIIWYVMGAAAVVSLLIIGIPAMMSSQGDSTTKEKKPKKAKKAKAPKAPKAKKQKPEKPKKKKKAKK